MFQNFERTHQTRNKQSAKARFLTLLSRLWQTDAITNKTNITKSFMKTGVFPLNPTCIDRSKILENPMAPVSDSSFNDTNNSSVDNISNSDNCISASDTSDTTHKHDNNQSIYNSITQVLATDAPIVPLSITSDEATLLLDQVIQESISNEEEQHYDYCPASNTSATGMNTFSKGTQSSSQPKTIDRASTEYSKTGSFEKTVNVKNHSC